MPLYEYECDACGKKFEVIQKFSDPPADACRVCGKGPVQRLLSSPAIQFKGSGWYITDYARKGGGDGSAKGSDGAEGGSKTDTGATGDAAAKTEVAAEKKSAATPAPAAATPKE